MVFGAKFSSENFFFPFEKHSETNLLTSTATDQKAVSVGGKLAGTVLLAAVSLFFWDFLHELLRKSWDWVSDNSVLHASTQGKL